MLILDNHGQPVWFHPTPHLAATNFRAAMYKGEPVLTWWEGKTKHGLGDGEHVIFDRSYREIARFPAGGGLAADLHEFVVTPQGTALVAAWDLRTLDLSKTGQGRGQKAVVEGVVQELEIPSARVLFEWRSLDHVSVAETYAGVGVLFDYFHINSIDVDADGDLLVSARNTWAVYKVARRDGAVVWRLGGKKSDFELGKGAHFAWQHDARHHGHGDLITIFDNGASPQVEPQSRAIALALDMNRKRATLTSAYTHIPPVLAHIFGNVQTQPNGNVFVGWGASPYFTEYGPDGSVRFDATLPRGGESYRAFRFPWNAQPAEAPALAARHGRLYASWNGTTETAAWQLLTGRTKTALKPISTVPKSGFETVLTPPANARFAAVTALDRDHKPLATTPTIASLTSSAPARSQFPANPPRVGTDAARKPRRYGPSVFGTRQQPTQSAGPEVEYVKPSLAHPGEEQRGDEEPAEHEEDIDPQEAARRAGKPEMERHHRGHREQPQAVQRIVPRRARAHVPAMHGHGCGVARGGEK